MNMFGGEVTGVCGCKVPLSCDHAKGNPSQESALRTPFSSGSLGIGESASFQLSREGEVVCWY